MPLSAAFETSRLLALNLNFEHHVLTDEHFREFLTSVQVPLRCEPRRSTQENLEVRSVSFVCFLSSPPCYVFSVCIFGGTFRYQKIREKEKQCLHKPCVH